MITTLFCDLVGFTAISERNDAELVDAMLRRYYSVVRKAIESYGGTVEKYIGDAVVAVFGVPLLHEDDPERAVRAGLRIVDEVDALPAIAGAPLEVRVGVNTGEALVRLDVDPGSGEGLVTGDAVNVAARLQSVAPPMAVAVGEATHAATERVFTFDACHPVSLKGKSQPLPAWIATASLARTGSDLRSFTTSFVGRKEELAALLDLLRESTGGSSLRFALVVGEAGIGKSRLLAEFARQLDKRSIEVTWRQGRCLPFGSGVTFWALSEIVRSCAGILESDGVARAEARLEAVLPEGDEREAMRSRLRPLVGLEAEEASREENFAAWRGFLEHLALDAPTVLVVEDLHWADEAMLAFMDHLAESAAERPLLVLATARPEILDLTGPGAVYVTTAQRVALGPLSGDETAQLLLVRLNAMSLPVGLQARLLERSGGNPLFAEELVRLLEDRDLLEIRGGQTTLKEGAELPTPGSIGALIAARLDLLVPDRKALLADAAVVGRSFWAGAVAAVSGKEPADVLLGLHELVAKELVRPERGSTIEGEAEFSFVHALVCDVAYAQLTRADRAVKHARLAKWLEERTAGRTEDLAEILAYHYGTALEMASSCGLELEDELLEPTSRYLALAGGRAAPLDASASAAHFARAQQVTSEAARPRRWLLSRRTRRTLRRRAPRLAVAASVVALTVVTGLGIWAFAWRSADKSSASLTPVQIEASYAPSVVRITTPVMPPEATGTGKAGRIVGSGFMATNDGVIVTSAAVVMGHSEWPPAFVTVEYLDRSGLYDKTKGYVWHCDPGTGLALITVDQHKVHVQPLSLGVSDSLTEGQKVISLSLNAPTMVVSRATGTVTNVLHGQSMDSGNELVVGIESDMAYPKVKGEIMGAMGGPLFDQGGHAIGVVGPLGVGLSGAKWSYGRDAVYQAVAIKMAITDIAGTSKGFPRGGPYLGIQYRPLDEKLAAALGLGVSSGDLVEDVVAGTPAEEAGMRGGSLSRTVDGTSYLTGGDVIVAVDGVKVSGSNDFGQLLARHKAGDVISLRIWREGGFVSLRAKLAEVP